jgi:hypothetical protein
MTAEPNLDKAPLNLDALEEAYYADPINWAMDNPDVVVALIQRLRASTCRECLGRWPEHQYAPCPSAWHEAEK